MTVRRILPLLVATLLTLASLAQEIPAGTRISVRTGSELNSGKASAGRATLVVGGFLLVIVWIFASVLTAPKDSETREQQVDTVVNNSQTEESDEATQLGIGGARLWYLHNHWHGESLSGVSGDAVPYYLGSYYASQYCSSPLEREKFARAFEAELKRLVRSRE